MQIDFQKCREKIAGSLNEFCSRWCKREHIECDALNDWKLNIFKIIVRRISFYSQNTSPVRVAPSVGHPTHKSGVLGSIPGLATYFRFSFRFFKKGSCQLLAKVCARSTG